MTEQVRTGAEPSTIDTMSEAAEQIYRCIVEYGNNILEGNTHRNWVADSRKWEDFIYSLCEMEHELAGCYDPPEYMDEEEAELSDGDYYHENGCISMWRPNAAMAHDDEVRKARVEAEIARDKRRDG